MAGFADGVPRAADPQLLEWQRPAVPHREPSSGRAHLARELGRACGAVTRPDRVCPRHASRWGQHAGAAQFHRMEEPLHHLVLCLAERRFRRHAAQRRRHHTAQRRRLGGPPSDHQRVVHNTSWNVGSSARSGTVAGTTQLTLLQIDKKIIEGFGALEVLHRSGSAASTSGGTAQHDTGRANGLGPDGHGRQQEPARARRVGSPASHPAPRAAV